GYLYAFILAAALVGWLTQRTWNRAALPIFIGMLAASILILVIGVGWLYVSSPVSLSEAVVGGALALLPGTVLKVAVATGIVSVGWWLVGLDDRRRAIEDLA